ncbi:hypothetical protein HPP92_017078 [Vanilla planifolia]|uniref:Uncharacterized protein n=1 Tax=Vanilla planifolia TaxID=51239 RepID=A0A835UQP2_VANPL|nr:hypothetical protein HPP92_017078 [Vanilla planifolia]
MEVPLPNSYHSKLHIRLRIQVLSTKDDCLDSDNQHGRRNDKQPSSWKIDLKGEGIEANSFKYDLPKSICMKTRDLTSTQDTEVISNMRMIP